MGAFGDIHRTPACERSARDNRVRTTAVAESRHQIRSQQTRRDVIVLNVVQEMRQSCETRHQLTSLLSSVQTSLAELKVEVASARKLSYGPAPMSNVQSSRCPAAFPLTQKGLCLLSWSFLCREKHCILIVMEIFLGEHLTTNCMPCTGFRVLCLRHLGKDVAHKFPQAH